MTQAEFKAQLETTKLPVYYLYAPIGTKVPFITYDWNSDNFGADNKVYQRIANVTVYYYHADYDDSSALETVFNENELFWNVERVYSADQKVYLDTYTMEVLDDE